MILWGRGWGKYSIILTVWQKPITSSAYSALDLEPAVKHWAYSLDNRLCPLGYRPSLRLNTYIVDYPGACSIFKNLQPMGPPLRPVHAPAISMITSNPVSMQILISWVRAWGEVIIIFTGCLVQEGSTYL